MREPFFDLGAEDPLPYQQQLRQGVPVRQFRHGLEQIVVAFEMKQTRDLADDDLAILIAQFAADRVSQFIGAGTDRLPCRCGP